MTQPLITHMDDSGATIKQGSYTYRYTPEQLDAITDKIKSILHLSGIINIHMLIDLMAESTPPETDPFRLADAIRKIIQG